MPLNLSGLSMSGGGRVIRPVTSLPKKALTGFMTRERRIAAMLMLPTLVFLALFFGVPLLRTAYGSVGGSALDFSYYTTSVTDSLYLRSVVRTFVIAANVTLMCLVLGYPVAYFMTTLSKRSSALLSILILVPLFTAFLIRTYAWTVILGRNGVLNKLLLAIGVIDAPIKLLGTTTAVYIGMVHVLLPIAIFTMYASLTQIDRSLIKAAQVIGATPVQSFTRVYLPMTAPAAISASVLVFIMAIGFYITPVLLGGPSDTMISQLIVTQITSLLNLQFGYALSMILLISTIVVLLISSTIVPIERLWALQESTNAAAPGRRRFRPGRLQFAQQVLSRLEKVWHALLGRPPWLVPALVKFHVGLVVAFLVAPLAIVYLLSFSSSPFLVFPPPGFSLRWYEKFLNAEEWRSSLLMSLRLGAIVASISVVAGAAAAFGLVRGPIRAKRAVFLFILAPLLVPIIVLSIGLYGAIADLGLLGSFFGLVIGHLVLALPYAVLVLIAAVRALDRNIEYAAANLGAKPSLAFRKVVLPTLFPALATAWVMSFLASFDELLISIFLLGRQTPTLPIKMWNDIRMQVDPTISAASSVIVTLIVVVIVVTQYRNIFPRRTKAKDVEQDLA